MKRKQEREDTELCCKNRVKLSEQEEPVIQCYKWQVGQPKMESWAGTLKEELDTVGLSLPHFAMYGKMRERKK